MPEERFTRRVSSGIPTAFLALDWAREVIRQDFGSAHDVQIIIEQNGTDWSATVSGTCVISE